MGFVILAFMKSWREKLNINKSFVVKKLDKNFSDMKVGQNMLIATPKIIDEYINQIPKGTDVNPYLSGSKKTAEKPKTQEAIQEVIETKSEKKIDDSSKTTIKTDRIFISPLAENLDSESLLAITFLI